MNAWDAMKADTYRIYGKFSWMLTMKGAIKHRTFRVIVSLRLCQAVADSQGIVRFALPLFRILHSMVTHWAAVDLSWRINVGAGLAINHGWGLVVSPGTRIGDNVTLFHGVTLGRRDRISKEGRRITQYPVLENEVWVGPHAIIVGGAVIGRGSRIAGGAFITDSVPPNSVVSGNPGKIVKRNCVADVLNPFQI